MLEIMVLAEAKLKLSLLICSFTYYEYI